SQAETAVTRHRPRIERIERGNAWECMPVLGARTMPVIEALAERERRTSRSALAVRRDALRVTLGRGRTRVRYFASAGFYGAGQVVPTHAQGFGATQPHPVGHVGEIVQPSGNGTHFPMVHVSVGAHSLPVGQGPPNGLHTPGATVPTSGPPC